MTPEQYKERKKQLERKLEVELINLAKEYALANNPYKEGDVLQDHIGKIRVRKIQVSASSFVSGSNLPTCVYTGLELKKDGTPTAKGTERSVWQQNLIK